MMSAEIFDGRIKDMPFEQYRALAAANAHGLMKIERSPAHFRYEQQHPHDPTPAQQLGTLAHMAVLEPERFDGLVAVEPVVNKRTNTGKETLAAWREAIPVNAVIATAEQVELCRDMALAVREQPFARALLADGVAERTLLWTDEETGVCCKARPDWLCGGHEVVVDLKTAADASPEEFKRSAGQYRYHMQAAFYSLGAATCGLPNRAFVFVVVETAPPFGVALYQLDDEAMHAGRVRVRLALERYAESLDKERWPSYPTEIQSLSLARWAL